MLKRFMLAILVIFSHTAWSDQTEQSLIVLKERVEQYLLNQLVNQQEGNIKVTANKIDSRLHLKSCADDKIEIFNPYQSALTGSPTMGVRCEETDNHWTIYIGTHITIEKPVVTLRNNLIKGAVIKAEDLQLSPMDISQLKQGYFSDPAQVIGQVTKQNLNQGSTLLPGSLQNDVLIHKGQQVSIEAINDNFKVSMTGIALSNGTINDLVKVKNLSSNKVIEAQVISRSEVKVAL